MSRCNRCRIALLLADGSILSVGCRKGGVSGTTRRAKSCAMMRYLRQTYKTFDEVQSLLRQETPPRVAVRTRPVLDKADMPQEAVIDDNFNELLNRARQDDEATVFFYTEGRWVIWRA